MSEREQITRRFAGLLVKRPGIAAGFWGPPGIGKSHASQQLLRETPCQHLSLHATTSARDLALALPHPARPASWVERTLERVSAGDPVETKTLTEAIAATLSQLAPFIVHLEDLHEASPEQTEFVQGLARVVPQLKGVGLIVTSRQPPPEPLEAIALQALSLEETRQLLEGEIAAGLPLECAQWIQTRSNGNPLFALEFLRFLTRQGFVWNDTQRWRWREPAPTSHAMPGAIEALLEESLLRAANTPALLATLEAKAVIGRDATQTLWVAVAGLSDAALSDAQGQFERERLLLDGEFIHPLFAEILMQRISSAAHRNYARRAIAALSADAIQASRFLTAAGLKSEDSFDLLRRAAHAFQQRGDPVRASQSLAAAVNHAALTARPALALEAAQMMRQVHLPEAIRLARQAQLDSVQHDQATVLIAELLAVQGHAQEAEQMLERLSDCGSLIWWQRVVYLRGVARNDSGVLEVLRDHPAVIEGADVPTLSHIVRCVANDGQTARAEQLVSSTLETSDLDAHDRVMLLKLRSSLAYAQSDLRLMVALEDQVLERASQLGHLRWVDAAYFNRAIALEALGDHAGCLAALEAAIRTCLELGDPTALAIAQTAYGRALHASAEYERAEEFNLSAYAILATCDRSIYLVDCEFGLARLYLDWPAPHAVMLAGKYARAALEHAIETQLEYYILEGQSLIALVQCKAGQAAQALEQMTATLEAARRLGVEAATAEVLLAHAHALEAVGEPTAAVTAWREAEDLFRQGNDLRGAQMVGLEADRLERDTPAIRARLEWFQTRELLRGATLAQRYLSSLSDDAPRPAIAVRNDTAQLNVLGRLHCAAGSATQTIRGQKRQELLAVLLEARLAGRRESSKFELAQALYPNSGSEQAMSALRETVRTTRAALTPDAIITTPQGYALGAITSDAEQFLVTGQTRLWRGAYLAGLALDARDDTVRESLHLALLNAANTALATDPHESIRVGRLLLEFDPYNLEYLTLCVKALRSTNNHRSLTRLYADARERLLEIGEVIPAHWQEFLQAVALKT